MELADLAYISKKLMDHRGIKISEIELREMMPSSDYNEYCEMINKLVTNGTITPVKNSGSNGMNPPLYKRYSIVKPRLDHTELIPEVRLLHGSLNIEGYLADLDKYTRHKAWLSLLDTFLKNSAHLLETPITINERSFQIFKKEKALKEDSGLASVLNFNPGLRELLNYYITPEPFFTYDVPHSDRYSNKRNLLIVENKDTWHSLRCIMVSGLCTIAGVRFDSLIYGEGKKIARKNDSLTEFNNSFYGDVQTCYYYFGDLDFEGISIVHDLIRTNPALRIEVFKPLYIAMLKEAEKSELSLPFSREKQRKEDAEWFAALFEQTYSDRIIDILQNGCYIPQEILNRQNLVAVMSAD